MSLELLFQSAAHRAERDEMPLVRHLIDRYSHEQPFAGTTIVTAHVLVRNALPVAEALWRGGARVVFAHAFPSRSAAPVIHELQRAGVEVLAPEQAVQAGDFFLDVNAVLGRLRLPRAAAEATRTGVQHYTGLLCPVVSADDSRAKRIEGFFGTGDGFLRAWRAFFPDRPGAGLRVIQFGYGKIGRGVAHRLRAADMIVTIVEASPLALARARQEGFPAVEAVPEEDLRAALAEADIVISVTGIPDQLSREIPEAWVRAARPVLVNMGAQDEFGPSFRDDEIAGGRLVPFNFHLDQPTRNRYVDPALAAHLMAMEAVVLRPESFPAGIHPLPSEMDEWLIRTWRSEWPEEDLTGIAEELGIGPDDPYRAGPTPI
jgi:adenosylhomocysteinase